MRRLDLDRLKAIRIISIVVSLGGLAEVIAWVSGIEILTSFSREFVTMKFSTAVSFVMSGMTLYFMAEAARGEVSKAQVVLPATALVILLFMATQLASVLFHVETGVERLFIKERPGAVMSVVPGMPSVMTMVDFIILSATGIAFLFRQNWITRMTVAAGAFIAFTGVLALLGYVLQAPLLYFVVSGISGGMAVPTAFLFILVGAGLLLVPGIRR